MKTTILGLLTFFAFIIGIVINWFIVWVAWNYTLPVLFKFPEITFYQAIALHALFASLLGSRYIKPEGDKK